MSDVLRPYTEFDSRELAIQLDEAVSASTALLLARNILGPVQRYADGLEKGIGKVEKGQREHAAGELGHYAVIGDSGNAIGAASLYPNLSLRRQRIPLPASMARRLPFVSQEFPHATPNIHAWTNGDNEALADAYSALTRQAGQPHCKTSVIGNMGEPTPPEPFDVTWTLEPLRSPEAVHDAILAKSNLKKVKSARFDDGEDGNKVPPLGMLYAQMRSEWYSSHGMLKELRTGRHSFAAHMTAGDEEMMSRNPKGF